MNKAALSVFEAILKEGTQSSVLDIMQTRKELYAMLDYHSYEDKLDQLFSKNKC
jgi:methylisocitrate lyase